MGIEWDEIKETRTVTTKRMGVQLVEVSPNGIRWFIRDVTPDDLRRACEAAGLVLATAQHAEDMAKLGREMSEVVAQRDDDLMAALCEGARIGSGPDALGQGWAFGI